MTMQVIKISNYKNGKNISHSIAFPFKKFGCQALVFHLIPGTYGYCYIIFLYTLYQI